jgi:HK97 family phage major capsid protein
MTTERIRAGSLPAAFSASFLAHSTIPGMPRVALAPDFGSGIAASEADFRAATTLLRRKLDEVTAAQQSNDRRLADVEQKSARRHYNGFGGPVGDGLETGGGRSLGAEVANSDALREFKANGFRGTSRLETKTTITSGIGSVGGALGGLIPPDRGGVEPMSRRPLTVRALCRPGRTESNTVTLMRQTTRTNGAAVAPEGTLKGESGMAWTEVAFKTATIATWVPVTRQALDDAAGLQALVDGELRANLGEREEDQLLFGNGTGDNLMGVVPQAQQFAAPFVVTNETPFDRLLMALAQASVANYRPSAIVLNLADAFALHAIKDQQGRYIGGGPYEGLVNLLWSIPWVGTNAMPQNQFVTGDFANAAQIFDRMDAEVLISDSHADFFVKNLYAIRAEQRLAFAVRAPLAFVTGQLVTKA